MQRYIRVGPTWFEKGKRKDWVACRKALMKNQIMGQGVSSKPKNIKIGPKALEYLDIFKSIAELHGVVVYLREEFIVIV